MDIFEKVKDLIADQLDVDDKDSITESSSITDDLGADSLDVVDLVMALEAEFNVEIPEDQVENIKTVGDIVKYIEENQYFTKTQNASRLCREAFLHAFIIGLCFFSNVET